MLNKNFVKICVGNSKSYINHDKLNTIFDAFFTENKENGTGLGLAIVKKMVTDLKGKIHCTSDSKIHCTSDSKIHCTSDSKIHCTSDSKGVEFIIIFPTSKL